MRLFVELLWGFYETYIVLIHDCKTVISLSDDDFHNMWTTLLVIV